MSIISINRLVSSYEIHIQTKIAEIFPVVRKCLILELTLILMIFIIMVSNLNAVDGKTLSTHGLTMVYIE